MGLAPSFGILSLGRSLKINYPLTNMLRQLEFKPSLLIHHDIYDIHIFFYETSILFNKSCITCCEKDNINLD